MKKLTAIIGLSLLTVTFLAAQNKPSPKKQPAQQQIPTQNNINKMLDDAMEQEDMTEEEKAEIRKMMGEATQMAKQAGVSNYNAGNSVPKIPAKQTTLLSKIPVVQTEQQLNAYYTSLLTECKKKYTRRCRSKGRSNDQRRGPK